MTQPKSFRCNSLCALCLGLLAIVGFEFVGGNPAPPAEIFGEPFLIHPLDAVDPEPMEIDPPPTNLIEVIAARPLFSRSRRPYNTPVVESVVKDVTFELIAVLLTETRRRALVRIEAQQPVWVQEKDWLSSWSVGKILADCLHLYRRNEVRIIDLSPDSADDSVRTAVKLVKNAE